MNFVKNETMKMRILLKNEILKCEFLDKLRIFAPVWDVEKTRILHIQHFNLPFNEGFRTGNVYLDISVSLNTSENRVKNFTTQTDLKRVQCSFRSTNISPLNILDTIVIQEL